MTTSANFQVIQNLYTAYSNSDLDAFYKDLSPNIIWRESDGFPTPGVFRTKKDIAENVFAILQRDWSHFRFELEHMIDGNENIVVVGTYRGIHGKTGKSFESRASHVWHLSGGKIDKFEQFADTHLMQCAARDNSE